MKRLVHLSPLDDSAAAAAAAKLLFYCLLSVTSFKTILLDCIVTAVISACIKKKLIKTGKFLCSHFNTEDGREKQHVQHIMLYYFKNGKNTTEMENKICECTEKVL